MPNVLLGCDPPPATLREFLGVSGYIILHNTQIPKSNIILRTLLMKALLGISNDSGVQIYEMARTKSQVTISLLWCLRGTIALESSTAVFILQETTLSERLLALSFWLCPYFLKVL